MFEPGAWITILSLAGGALLFSLCYRSLTTPKAVLRIDMETVRRAKAIFRHYRAVANGFESDRLGDPRALPCSKEQVHRALTVLLHYARRVEDQESLVLLRRALLNLSRFQDAEKSDTARRRYAREERDRLAREAEFFLSAGTSR